MIDSDKLLDKLGTFLTALLIASFQTTKTVSVSRYIILGLAGSVLLVKTRGRLELKLSSYYVFFGLMIAFAYASSMWAIEPVLAVTMGKRMVDAFIVLGMLYLSYQNDETPDRFMSGVKWGGYLIALYLIVLYKPAGLYRMMVSLANRMTNEYGNVNGHAMAIAYCCVIEMFETAREKRLKASSVFVVISVFTIAASQSRKALVIVLLGFVLTTVLYSLELKNFAKTAAVLLSSALLFVGLMWILSNTPLFSAIFNRMIMLTNSLSGEGYAGSSAAEREALTRIGWQQFLKTPLLGVGMDNSFAVTSNFREVHTTYLHNNYAELLCDGGSVGFIIYYSRYIYIMAILGKNLFNRTPEYIPCVVMMILLLIMDYGSVTYYERMDQVFVLLLFLQARAINSPAKPAVAAPDCRTYKYVLWHP